MTHRITLAGFLVIALLVTAGAIAQTKPVTGNISGDVKNTRSENIETGTIVVLETATNKLVKTDIWENARITINQLPGGSYTLVLSSTGYVEKQVTVNVNSAELQLGTIVMEQNTVKMQEVVVKSKKPIVQVTPDQITFNVSQTTIATGGTAEEMLQKTPRVMNIGTGNYVIAGKGTALVLVNGQRIPAEAIASLPSNDIEKIEVISNPPASMEAGGRGIINIITKPRAVKTGATYALADVSLARGRDWRSSIGLTAGAREKRWSIEANVRYFPSSLVYTDEYYREMNIGNQPYRFDQQLRKDRDLNNRYSYRVNGTYTLSSKSNVSAYVSNIITRGSEVARSSNDVMTNSAATSYILFNNTFSDLDIENRSAGIAFTSKLDSSGKELNVVADYNQYRSNRDDHFYETFRNGGGDVNLHRRSLGGNNITIRAAQANLLLPVAKWKARFDVGARYNYITSLSSLLFSQNEGGNWTKLPTRSNEYDYSEQTAAVYANFNRQSGKWTVQGGLRIEHTSIEGLSAAKTRTVTDSSYTGIFPSFSIQHALSSKWAWELNYSRRILRPAYQDMDPFVIYFDSLSVFQGNPALRPEFAHGIEGSIVFKGMSSLKIGYNFVNNNIQKVVNRTGDSTQSYAGSFANIKRAREFSALITIPYQKKNWMMINVFGFFSNSYQTIIDNAPFSISRPFIYCYTYHQLTLPHNFTAEGSLTYNSAGASGIFLFNSRFNAMLGAGKLLLKKRMKVSVAVNDIFRTEREKGNTNANGLRFAYNSYYDNFYARIGISYRFGGSSNKSQQVSTGGADVKRIKTLD